MEFGEESMATLRQVAHPLDRAAGTRCDGSDASWLDQDGLSWDHRESCSEVDWVSECGLTKQS